MRKKAVAWAVLIGLLASWEAQAATTDPSALNTKLDVMQTQIAALKDLVEKQNLRIQQLESRTVLETAQPSATFAPSEVPAKERQDALKKDLGEAIPWLKGTKLGGDLRLRMENFDYSDKDTTAGATDRSRNRYRIRLRYGLEKDFGDDWKAGFRLATGTAGTNGLATDNTSTNVTLGNPGYFAYKNVYIDRAYALYSPSSLKDAGLLDGVTIGAGKFENPFLRYSTGMVWDADVTPEGLYEQVKFDLGGGDANKFALQTVLGQFVTHENSGLESDAQLFGYQGALTWSTSAFGGHPAEFALAASLYDYPNWSQTIGATNNLSTSLLRTNTIVADNFRVLDVYPEVQFAWGKTPVTLWGDLAENLANVGTEDVVRAGGSGNDIHDTDTAWGAGVKVGKAKKKGEWEAFYGYYEIGANAVVAAFNDSDFGGPGGQGFTNRMGHKAGFSYMLTDSIAVNWTGYVVRPQNPNSAVASSANENVFRSQADINWKF